MNKELRKDWDRAKAALKASGVPFERVVAYSQKPNGKLKRLGRFIAPTFDLGLRLAQTED